MTKKDLTKKKESAELVQAFLDNLWLEKGLSKNTQESYERDLRLFADWLEIQNKNLLQADSVSIQEYLEFRLQQKQSSRSSARFLSCVRGFYFYLLREQYITQNPAALIESPKLGRPLPKSLTEADVEALLNAPDLNDPIGLRDRTMLEILYACGLRVSELVTLTIPQVNLRQSVVRVMGKGGKERLIPMGQEAVVWLDRYMREARPVLLHNLPDEVLFPSNRGQVMTRQTFWHRIKFWAKVAGIEKSLSPHHTPPCICYPFAESRRRFTCSAVVVRA